MAESLIVHYADTVATFTLNRPESFNALNLELMDTLAENLRAVALDDSIRAVVITGAGKAFCAGGDLKWAQAYSRGPAIAFHELAGRFHQGILEIRRMPKPVIAAINGVAAGGGFSLALSCDFRVMASSAVLRQAYTASGLCIDGGGTYTLPRLVGMARALEIAAFDPPIPADQALSWQMITRIAPEGQALAAAWTMARDLAMKSIHAFGAVKKLITNSFSSEFESQIEEEREVLSRCSMHSDAREGLQAFVEKRKPVFAR